MNFNIQLRQDAQDIANPSTLLRTSRVFVKDSVTPIKVQLPCAYDGPHDSEGKEVDYTPEDLYLGALAGCFFTTLNVVSKLSKFNYKKLGIVSEGVMEEVDGVKMMSKITQVITLVIPSTENAGKAQKILDIVEKRCPLANSIKTELINEYKIETDSM